MPVLIATVLSVPLLLRHVLAALRGERPPFAVASVLVLAVVQVATVVVIGSAALSMLPALAVAAMLTVRLTCAIVVVAALAVVSTPIALAYGDVHYAFWYPVVVLWRSLTLYVLIWLVAAARRLERLRRELADQALFRERVRIDDELRGSVGVALADLAAGGEQVRALAGQDDVPDAFPALVATSRRTLANARQLAGRYQQPSLRAELATAVVLLGAAGITARAAWPAEGVTDADVGVLRAELRAAITRLLLDGGPVAVTFEIDGSGLRVVPDRAGVRVG